MLETDPNAAAMTIPALARAAASRWPDRPAVIDQDLTVTTEAMCDGLRDINFNVAAGSVLQSTRVFSGISGSARASRGAVVPMTTSALPWT